DRPVFPVGAGARLVGVRSRPVRQSEHGAVVRVHRDRCRPDGLVFVADLGQDRLGLLLQRRVDRQAQGLSRDGLALDVDADRLAAVGIDGARLAVAPGELAVVVPLDAARAGTADVYAAEQLPGQRAERVVAIVVGLERDARDLQRL